MTFYKENIKAELGKRKSIGNDKTYRHSDQT
jgi:hypothetical protein